MENKKKTVWLDGWQIALRNAHCMPNVNYREDAWRAFKNSLNLRDEHCLHVQKLIKSLYEEECNQLDQENPKPLKEHTEPFQMRIFEEASFLYRAFLKVKKIIDIK